MISPINFTGVHSRRKLGRWVDWIAEVVKTVLTFALIIAMLSVALWSVLGVNPLREVIGR